jgi:hypothetical protein
LIQITMAKLTFSILQHLPNTGSKALRNSFSNPPRFCFSAWVR